MGKQDNTQVEEAKTEVVETPAVTDAAPADVQTQDATVETPAEAPADEVVEAPAEPATGWKIGDKITFSYNGIELPGIVSAILPFGDNGASSLLVQGDINGSDYPAGLPSGPFSNIDPSAVTAR